MTGPLDLRSADALSLGERTKLFNAAYEGYVVPFHLDEQVLAFMEDSFDVDLEASRIAYRDGAPVGLANLAVRGEDGWIAGVGVVTAARRGGVGEALMDAVHAEARARGLTRVWLEVIVENTGAFALYEKLGYRTVRDVAVWTLPLSVSGQTDAREVPAAEAHARIRELRTEREPWQRADETLAHFADVAGVATDAGAAVYRVRGESVQVVQIAGEAEPLLRALRVRGPVTLLNLPDDDPATAAFETLGGAVAVRQHEMLLEV
jgi:GNAT superfamily N-acetyltransferase